MIPYSPNASGGFPAIISLMDVSDPVQGGLSGTHNVPLKQLADAAAFLYANQGGFEGVTTLNNFGTSFVVLAPADVRRKLVRIFMSAASNIDVALPSLSAVPDGAIITIVVTSVPNAARKRTKIIASPAQPILYGTGASDNISLYSGESVTLARFGTLGWQVFSHTGSLFNVGDTLLGYHQKIGTLVRDGSLVARDDFPRLWKLVNDLQNAGADILVSESDWATGGTSFVTALRSKFAVGDGATTFRLPDDRGIFDRALDMGAGLDDDRISAGLGSKVGSRQTDALRSHIHSVDLNAANSAGATGSGKITTGNEAPEGNLPVLPTSSTGGSETRPYNTARIPLIIF